jgi:hypothetical protein
MPVTGKTGADSVYVFLKHICHIITKFGPKLTTVIDTAVSVGAISADEAVVARAFVTGAQAACNIWAKIAGISGF